MRRTQRNRRDRTTKRSKRAPLNRTTHNMRFEASESSPEVPSSIERLRTRPRYNSITNRRTRSMPALGRRTQGFQHIEEDYEIDPRMVVSPGEENTISPEDVDQIVDENRVLKQLHQIIDYLGDFELLDDLKSEIVELGLKVTNLERGLLATVDPANEENCQVRLVRGWKRGEQHGENFRLARRMITLAVKDKKAYFISDLTQQRKQSKRSDPLTIRCIVALPLKTHSKIIGVLIFASEEQRGDYSRSERALLEKYSRHAAQLYARLDDSDSGSRLERLQKSQRELQSRLGKARKRVEELESQSSLDGTLEEAKSNFYKNYLRNALEQNRNSYTRAAKAAGISRDHFIKLIQRYKVIKL